MEALTIAMLLLAGVLVGGIVLLGRFYPGSGADQLDWRPTRSPELEAQNEIDDVVQMREAINAKRRARGAPELTEEAVQQRVHEDLAARQAALGTRDEEHRSEA